MAQPSTTPPPRTGSPAAEPDSSTENEKYTPSSSSADGSVAHRESPDVGGINHDVERAILIEPQKLEEPLSVPDKSARSPIIWIVANIFATIGIVRLPISCSACTLEF
jgi:hypothetical protein